MASEAIGIIRAAFEGGVDEGRRRDLGRPSALGWATVELDRAAEELADALGLAPDAIAPAAVSTLLGARCRVALDGIDVGLALAILEPSTEGRLAASLARHGEGPAAVWFRVDEEGTTDATAPSSGPFGAERLVRPDTAGPSRLFLLTVGPGTIDR